MWRPVALSAFLALLFMSSRSGQEPAQTNPNEAAKSDFGATSTQESPEKTSIKIDLARASTHAKTTPPQESQESAETDAASTETKKTAETSAEDSAPGAVASVGSLGSQTIPVPAPKSDPLSTGTRVVVTQGEQKTALTTDEKALRLLPPGPDFAAKVQKELARIGCYHGRVDNVWGPVSRNAVARFNRLAKANLPLRQPTRALLSSARQAPDNYCTDAANNPSKIAALDLGDDLEALKNRPKYLPPWMRGEPMPEPDENTVEVDDAPEATPESSTETAREPRQRAQPQRTRRAAPSATERRRAVQRRQVRRRHAQQRRARQRQVRRSRSSFRSSLRDWPGTGAGR